MAGLSAGIGCRLGSTKMAFPTLAAARSKQHGAMKHPARASCFGVICILAGYDYGRDTTILGFEVVHCLSISRSGSLVLHRLGDREPAKHIIRVARMGELGLETALLYKVQGVNH